MLQIKINNEFLDLGQFSITFELLNPIFNDVGSFSYPFTIPLSPKNRTILQYPDRLHKSLVPQKYFDASIYVNGLPWKTGRLILREAGETTVKANFVVGEGGYFNKINDLNLHELPHSVYTPESPNLTMFLDVANYKYPNADFALFHHKNEHLIGDTNVPAYLEQYIDYFKEFNRYHPVTYYFSQFNTFMPFTYVNYAIDLINRTIGVNEKFNALKNDPELSQLVFANNTSASDLVNVNNYFRIMPIHLRNHVPRVKITDFFKVLEETFGLYVMYDDQTNSVSYRLMKDILNEPPVDLDVKYKINSFLTNDNEEGYLLEVNNEIIEELNNVRDLTNYEFKGSVATMADLPANATIDTDLYFVDDQLGFYYLADQYGNWSQAANVPYAWLRKSPGKRKINDTASFLHNLAAMKGNGFLDLGAGKWNEIPCSFLFYRGFVNSKSSTGGSDFYLQPLGTAYDQHPDFDGQFNYSMLWGGTKGRFEKFHRKTLDFFASTREAEFGIPFTPAQLKLIDFSRKYRLAQANWLFDKIRFTVTNNRISPATVTAWKV